MNENKELKQFNNINKQLKELSDLIIQRYNTIHQTGNKDIETWLNCRISALTESVTTKIKKYQNNMYNNKE